MASIMPPIPRFFFLYMESAMCLYGAIRPLIDPQSITAMLATTEGRMPSTLGTFWSLQWSTLIFMIALVNMAIMVYSTEPKVVRAYVLASAITDIPHWTSIAIVLNMENVLWEFGSWPHELKVQVLWPLVTFAMKLGYLAGLFGKDREPLKQKGN